MGLSDLLLGMYSFLLQKIVTLSPLTHYKIFFASNQTYSLIIPAPDYLLAVGGRWGYGQLVLCIWWDDMVYKYSVSPNGEGAPLWLNFVPSCSVSLCALHVIWSINTCEWMLRKGIMAHGWVIFDLMTHSVVETCTSYINK